MWRSIGGNVATLSRSHFSPSSSPSFHSLFPKSLPFLSSSSSLTLSSRFSHSSHNKGERKGYLIPTTTYHHSPPPSSSFPSSPHKHLHTSLPVPCSSSPPSSSSPSPPQEGDKKPDKKTTSLFKSLFGSKEGGDLIDSRVWPISMSSLLMGIAIGVVIPVMPLFARDIGLSPSDFGMVVSVMGLTRLVVNMPMAALGDSFGRRPLLVFGPLGTSFSMIGTGLSRSLFELLSWRFCTGVSGAAQMTGSQLYLADISHPGNRARTMSPMLMAWSTGVLIGPALGGIVAEQYGFRAPFTLVGLATAAVAMNNLRLTETRPASLTQSPPSLSKLQIIGRSYGKAFRQWGELLKNRDICAGVLMQAMYWFCLSGAQFTILPILGTEKFGLAVSSVGGMFALMAGINIVGSQPVAYLSDKYGRKLVIGSGALTVSLALALLPFATETWELISLLSVWGVGASLWGSAPTTYISDLTTSENRSQALAMLRSAGDFGLMCGALVAGYVVDFQSMEFALGMNSSVLLGSTVMFSLVARESIHRASRK